MDPFQQHTGLSLLMDLFKYYSRFFIWYLANNIHIEDFRYFTKKRDSSLFLAYIFCIVHYLWVMQAGNDVLEHILILLIYRLGHLGFWTQDQYITNIFMLNFYRIFSYYLKFSLFTTFLVINIIGNNAILLIEYFYKKLSIDFPKNFKFVFGLFIWLPTLHFWTALGKDALVILGIILITYSLENLKKRFLFAIPSLIIITY